MKLNLFKIKENKKMKNKFENWKKWLNNEFPGVKNRRRGRKPSTTKFITRFFTSFRYIIRLKSWQQTLLNHLLCNVLFQYTHRFQIGTFPFILFSSNTTRVFNAASLERSNLS